MEQEWYLDLAWLNCFCPFSRQSWFCFTVFNMQIIFLYLFKTRPRYKLSCTFKSSFKVFKSTSSTCKSTFIFLFFKCISQKIATVGRLQLNSWKREYLTPYLKLLVCCLILCQPASFQIAVVITVKLTGN